MVLGEANAIATCWTSTELPFPRPLGGQVGSIWWRAAPSARAVFLADCSGMRNGLLLSGLLLSVGISAARWAQLSESDTQAFMSLVFTQEVASKPWDSFCTDDINKLQRKSSQTFPCCFCPPNRQCRKQSQHFLFGCLERLLLTGKAKTHVDLFFFFKQRYS